MSGIWTPLVKGVGGKKPGQVVLPLWDEMFSYLIWVLVLPPKYFSCQDLPFGSVFLSPGSPTHIPTLPLQTVRGLLRAKRTTVSYSHKSPRKLETYLFVFPISFRPLIS